MKPSTRPPSRPALSLLAGLLLAGGPLALPAGAQLTPKPQIWHQADIPGEANETDDYFAQALAAGDFDGDGYADLAMGAPEEDIGATLSTGSVQVLYGGSSGLSTVGAQSLNQGNLEGGHEAGDRFGQAIAAGDFDGDGYDDLAVGLPGEDLGATDAGSVIVFYGSPSGLSTSRTQALAEGRAGLLDSPEASDEFGYALATGDFNGDLRDDLVIGVPGEARDFFNAGGAAHVIPGSASGLVTASDQRMIAGLAGAATTSGSSRFGAVLASGDFNHDGRDDLAVGAPRLGLSGASECGAVHLIPGSAQGIVIGQRQFWTQSSLGHNAAEIGDRFGSALAAGDFNGDSYDDLAIGLPFEQNGTQTFSSGAVELAYGSVGGLLTTAGLFFHQDTFGVADTNESDDRFGLALAAADLDGDGRGDLVVGAGGEADATGFVLYAGAAQVFHGAGTGLNLTSSLLIQPGPGAPESLDFFGSFLALGDFNADGTADIAVAAQGEDLNGLQNVGEADVFYSPPGQILFP